jgi:hypothetical protein
MKHSMKIKRRYLSFFKSESGVMPIIEAAFVFPITFFVIFFMIYFGNMYYVKSQVDSLTSCEAIKGAQYYANPWVKIVHEENADSKVPTNNQDVQPYLKFMTNKTIQQDIQQETLEKIRKINNGFFSGMSAKNIRCQAKYKNYYIYSTFSVQINYRITFPIRFIFSRNSTSINFSAYDTSTVTDNCEFIRDTDMVIDMIQRTKTYQKVKEKMAEIKSKIDDFGKKFK